MAFSQVTAPTDDVRWGLTSPCPDSHTCGARIRGSALPEARSRRLAERLRDGTLHPGVQAEFRVAAALIAWMKRETGLPSREPRARPDPPGFSGPVSMFCEVPVLSAGGRPRFCFCHRHWHSGRCFSRGAPRAFPPAGLSPLLLSPKVMVSGFWMR